MLDLIKLAFGGHEIRTVVIDGAPWFVAADVCRALELDTSAGTYQHLRKLHDDEKRLLSAVHLPQSALGRAPTASAISESGLYRLVNRSDKAQARPFQDWVNREVLPAIRKDGSYVLGEEKVRTGEMSEDELIIAAMGAQGQGAGRIRFHHREGD